MSSIPGSLAPFSSSRLGKAPEEVGGDSYDNALAEPVIDLFKT